MKKVKKTKTGDGAIAASVKDIPVFDFAKDCMMKYGAHTIEQRAIPDHRDGLIPVYRRLLWAALEQHLPPTRFVKSARVVGDVIGKFHPHGDKSAYDGITTLVQAPTPLFDGSGNWGSIDDPKAVAAMRYTECRLSRFARANFFTKYQVKALDLVENYDGSLQEPVILHSNLPFALLFPAIGIAVGVTVGIPSYTPKSVAKLVRKAVNGSTITVDDALKTLEFKFEYPSHIDQTCVADGTLKKFYKTGSATLRFVADHEVLDDRIIIRGLAPNSKWETAAAKSAEIEGVRSVHDDSDEEHGTEMVIEFKRGLAPKEKKKLVATILRAWTSTVVMRMNTTHRGYDPEEGLATTPDFIPTTVPKLINDWVSYRLDLEKRMAKIEADDRRAEIRSMELTILASLNLAVIEKALKEDDSEAYLVKKLKITQEEAKTILDKTLRSLKATNVDALKKQIKQRKERIEELRAIHKKPNAEVLAKMDEALEQLGAYD